MNIMTFPSAMSHKKIYAVAHLPNFAAQTISTYYRDFRGYPFAVTQQVIGSHKTMVYDCSPEALALGIYPKMAIHEIEPELYKKISLIPRNKQLEIDAQIDILRSVQDITPAVNQLDENEFLLDITATPAVRAQGIPATGAAIREAIQKQQGFNQIAVGISHAKICAQVLARSAVPDTVVQNFDSDNTHFYTLDVGLLPGLSRADYEKLEKLGIIRIGQLKNLGRGMMRRIFGNRGERLLAVANGMDLRSGSQQKEILIIAEEILETDINVQETLHKIFLRLLDRVFHQIQNHKLLTAALVLTIVYGDGQKSETRIQLKKPAQTIENRQQLQNTFDETYTRRVAVRSIILRAGKLQPDHGQLSLFDPDTQKAQSRNKAIMKIRQRFGFGALETATYFGLKQQ